MPKINGFPKVFSIFPSMHMQGRGGEESGGSKTKEQ